jgi:hypothetical protein
MPKTFACILFALPLLAQTPVAPVPTGDTSPERNVAREILVELRAMRQMLGRALSAQVQLLLSSEQVKIAYQMMTSRGERLESVRGEIGLVHGTLLEATRNAENFESQLRQLYDPEQKGSVEKQLREQKALIAEYQERESELRGNEARLSREFQDAQSRMEQASANLTAIASEIQRNILVNHN